MIMKTYFVFLSLFVLTAARQIQIKNLKEEKQEKLLHSSPISRPLKRSRRGVFWKKAAKWAEKAAKDTAKAAAKAAEDAAKAAAKAAEDAAKVAADALCTNLHTSCAYWANQNYCTKWYVAYMIVNCRKSCNICIT